MLDVDVELNFIDLFKPEYIKPSFKNVNTTYIVPTLFDDENDLELNDSYVILMHLCDKYGKNHLNLWPQEYKDRLKVTNMLPFEAGLMFRRESELMCDIICNTFKNVQIPYHQRNVHEIYGICEVFLNKNKYLASDYLTIADTVDLMFPITVAQWPKLEYEINKKGLQELIDVMEEMGKFKYPTK